MRLATSREQAAMEDLGRRLAEQARELVRHDGSLSPDADEQETNTLVGRVVILAIAAAANEVEWLNRVYLIDGLGEALGEMLGSFPDSQGQRRLAAILNASITRGFDASRAALKPQGRA